MPDEKRQHELDTNGAVKAYVDARILSDRRAEEARVALLIAEEAKMKMHKAWWKARDMALRPGIYSFKEHSRTAVVLTGCDYPPLVEIVS